MYVSLRSPARLTVVALLAVAAAAALMLAAPDPATAALQKIAGYQKSGDNRFGSVYEYFSNLRDAILPLSIPIGAIGMVVGGGMYVFGNPQAGRLLFGVVVGMGLIMMAPSIVA
jgi:hypothetical protein